VNSARKHVHSSRLNDVLQGVEQDRSEYLAQEAEQSGMAEPEGTQVLVSQRVFEHHYPDDDFLHIPVPSARAEAAEVAEVADVTQQSLIGSDMESGFMLSSVETDLISVSAAPERGEAQRTMRAFVRSMVKGRTVNVLSTKGGLAECIASLDRKLTVLSLQRSKDGPKRGIALEEVSEVCVGNELGEDVGLQLDDLCVTLLLKDKQAIGFRFLNAEERDTFALCMSMFVDGRRKEIKRSKRKESKTR